MPNYLLALIVVLLVVLIGYGHLRNYLRKKRVASSRDATAIEKIRDRDFPDLDSAFFSRIWTELSSVLEMDPEKLLPSDTINDFVRARHMPELLLGNVEEYLRDNGLEPSQFGVDVSVRDVIVKLAEKSARNGTSQTNDQ